MIEVNQLSFYYNESEVPSLDNVTMTVQKGTVTTILGPNGSGKTTLLKCLAGFYKTQTGEISINGRNLTTLSSVQRSRLISYMPQNHHTVFPYRVVDIVLMGRSCHLSLFAAPRKKDYDLALDALKTVGIGRLSQRIYTKLSGGEKQLVLIARSLAQESPVMFMDEPISHLDYKNQITVLRLIRTILSEHKLTILITLHDPNMAAAFSDEIVLFKNGKILRKGNIAETITSGTLTELYEIKITVSGEGKKMIQPLDV